MNSIISILLGAMFMIFLFGYPIIVMMHLFASKRETHNDITKIIKALVFMYGYLVSVVYIFKFIN